MGASLSMKLDSIKRVHARTQVVLRGLAEEHLGMRRHIGGIAKAFGYTLENEAFRRALPALLQRDFGISVTARLRREHIRDRDSKPLEVSIFGEGTQNGKQLIIVGEAKSRLSKNDVDAFTRSKLQRLEGVFEAMFAVLVTHMTTDPEVEEHVRDKGLPLLFLRFLTDSTDIMDTLGPVGPMPGRLLLARGERRPSTDLGRDDTAPRAALAN